MQSKIVVECMTKQALRIKHQTIKVLLQRHRGGIFELKIRLAQTCTLFFVHTERKFLKTWICITFKGNICRAWWRTWESHSESVSWNLVSQVKLATNDDQRNAPFSSHSLHPARAHTHTHIFLGTWNLADSWGKHNHMEVLADKERIKEFVLLLTAGGNFLQTWDQTEGGLRRWSNKCVYKGCVVGALGTKPPLDDCVSSCILLSCPHFARLQHVFFVIHGSLIHNDMELQQYNFLDTKLQAPRTLPPLLLFWGLLSSQSRALISLAFWKSFFSYLFS